MSKKEAKFYEDLNFFIYCLELDLKSLEALLKVYPKELYKKHGYARGDVNPFLKGERSWKIKKQLDVISKISPDEGKKLFLRLTELEQALIKELKKVKIQPLTSRLGMSSPQFYKFLDGEQRWSHEKMIRVLKQIIEIYL